MKFCQFLHIIQFVAIKFVNLFFIFKRKESKMQLTLNNIALSNEILNKDDLFEFINSFKFNNKNIDKITNVLFKNFQNIINIWCILTAIISICRLSRRNANSLNCPSLSISFRESIFIKGFLHINSF